MSDLEEVDVEQQLKVDGYLEKSLKNQAGLIYQVVDGRLDCYKKELDQQIQQETDTKEKTAIKKNFLDKFISKEFHSFLKTMTTKKSERRTLLKKCLLNRETALNNLLSGKSIEPRSKDFFCVYIGKKGWNDFVNYCISVESDTEEDLDIVWNKINKSFKRNPIEEIQKKEKWKQISQYSSISTFSLILLISFLLLSKKEVNTSSTNIDGNNNVNVQGKAVFVGKQGETSQERLKLKTEFYRQYQGNYNLFFLEEGDEITAIRYGASNLMINEKGISLFYQNFQSKKIVESPMELIEEISTKSSFYFREIASTWSYMASSPRIL